MGNAMPFNDLSAQKKRLLRRQVWTADWLERRDASRIAGDQAAVDRINFGRYLKMMRLGSNLTKVQAGRNLKHLRKLEESRKRSPRAQVKRNRKERLEDVDREREEWHKWEKAEHLPKDVTIRRLAAVLDGDPAAFLRHAGRPVPSQLLNYDEVWATRTFRQALRRAKSFVQLADIVQAIWQKYIFEQTGARAHIKIDQAYSEVLETVYLYLDEKQHKTRTAYCWAPQRLRA
jgi:hypothetical protein